MAYDVFSLDAVKQQFGLRTDERGDYFAAVTPRPVSDFLRQTLSLNLPLALALSNEKARSELLIMPILLEVYRQTQQTFSLFSGVEFNVDFSKGLAGFCDYLLSLSPEQLIVEAPVVAIVEAKKDNINAGIGQCLAEMLAARMFNTQRGNASPRSTGSSRPAPSGSSCAWSATRHSLT